MIQNFASHNIVIYDKQIDLLLICEKEFTENPYKASTS